jgi:hypothetical protein
MVDIFTAWSKNLKQLHYQESSV